MKKTRQTKRTKSNLLPAVAHAFILAQGAGILASLFIYASQREKDRYISFQALQAAVYQVTAVLLFFLFLGGGLIAYFAVVFPGLASGRGLVTEGIPIEVLFSAGIIISPIILMILTNFYGLWAAFQVWRGTDFHYVLIGKLVERFFFKDQEGRLTENGEGSTSPSRSQ